MTSWYCDNAPDGRYVKLIRDSHLETHAGRVELPGNQNLLYIDLGPGNRFAGVGHKDDLCWEWDGRNWVSHGGALGPRAVIYDAAGTLQIVRQPGTATGSQGWRYIGDNGALVPSDSSYADPARKIWEYTTHAGVTIGQGGNGPLGEDPAIVLIDGTRRVLSSGQCRFIKFRLSGTNASIAFVREDKGEAMLLWKTLADLRALPIDVPPPPPPVVIPPPPPEPKMPVAPNKIDVVRSVIAAHPEINRVQDGVRGDITRLTVLALGGFPWGRKDRDRDPNNHNESDDALCYRLTDGKFEIYDILNGSDGSATWDYKGTFADGQNGFFREVPGDSPQPIPAPVPDKPQPIDLSEVLQKLDNLGIIAGAANVAAMEALDKLALILAALDSPVTGTVAIKYLGTSQVYLTRKKE